MTTRTALAGAVAGACLIAIAPGTNAAQRTFVSTLGNDLNACSLAAPCRGFTRALVQTDASGEIVVLDSGGYGSVAVDSSVSIVSPPGAQMATSSLPGWVPRIVV